jgi:tryptophan 7-halogenase
VFRHNNELFAEPSWIQVMHGQRIYPRGYHPLVDAMPEAKVREHVETVQHVIANCVEAMPTHADFIARACPAEKLQAA